MLLKNNLKIKTWQLNKRIILYLYKKAINFIPNNLIL